MVDPEASAGILIIGDEILSGKVADANAPFLIAQLRELGVSVREVRMIPDDLESIAAAVRELSGGLTHLFTSGGVGPTHDDLTMQGVAAAFGTEVVRHPELERILRDYFGERLAERDLRMADVPRTARLVFTKEVSWPVVTVGNVYVLPGIPAVLQRKFLAIRERFSDRPFHCRRIFLNREEGPIADGLEEIARAFPVVSVGSYPTLDPGDHRVMVTVESKDAAAVASACGAIEGAFAQYVVRVE